MGSQPWRPCVGSAQAGAWHTLRKQPYQMRQRFAKAGLKTRCRSQKQCLKKRSAQPVRTARGSHGEHSQRQLTGHPKMRFAVCGRCGSWFLDAVFVRPAHLVSVPGKRLVSRPWSHSTSRAGAHLPRTPHHPSLPDAPVLVAPRTSCCDSKFRRPTGDCRVLASVITALTAIVRLLVCPGIRINPGTSVLPAQHASAPAI